MSKKVRIGIDVGGTFTDAVIIDNETYEIIAKKKIPTTHEQGVAAGVVQIISELIRENGIAPEDVTFIAHGTTQATNALLEGDVASVGVLGMGTGMDAYSARNETQIGNIELATGKYLKCSHTFLDSKTLTEAAVDASIDELRASGAEVIVASEAYSVDNPTNELFVAQRANEKDLYATCGHEISQLYGLKMRTRTAVVNASLIPKMIETANMTETAVHDTNISTDLMIMRCDGGVMSINEVRKRPILTMLSGLAAGVAGALMYEKVSDGIFLEVGGTSVDISVIKNGKVMIKYAQVGGHKTYLQSLDVRTLGIAGGSMIRVDPATKRIISVGPRSAHIAGLKYECFCEADFTNASVQMISPRSDDPCEYVALRCQNGEVYSLTLAGAANLLGYVPQGDYAFGNQDANRAAWEAFGAHLGISAEQAARTVVDLAIQSLKPVLDDLIAEYELDRNFITLVGGGGSGAVVVFALAEHMQFDARLAKNAPFISTIGVALAMVREQVERTVVNPNEDDIKRIRQEVIEKIVRSGANEATVDVTIEVDMQKNLLRAIATGATELRQKNLAAKDLPLEELTAIAAQALGMASEQVRVVEQAGRWRIFKGEEIKKAFFGLLKQTKASMCVIDREGTVRLRKAGAQCARFRKNEMSTVFRPFLDENTTYSDANASIPRVFAFYREKILDLSSLQTADQVMSLLQMETEFLSDEDEILAVAYR